MEEENETLVQRIISRAARGDDQRRKGSQILCSGGEEWRQRAHQLHREDGYTCMFTPFKTSWRCETVIPVSLKGSKFKVHGAHLHSALWGQPSQGLSAESVCLSLSEVPESPWAGVDSGHVLQFYSSSKLKLHSTDPCSFKNRGSIFCHIGNLVWL